MTKKMTEAQMRKHSAKFRKALAQRLAQARTDAVLTQGELAKRSGVDRKTINRIENEHFSPSIDTFLRICQALRINPAATISGQK